MRSKIFFGFAVCIILASIVSASTSLNIHTLPNHEVYITEVDAYSKDNVPAIQPFSTFTGDEGEFTLDYTPEKSIFKLGLLLKKESGTRVISYTVLDDLMHDDKKEIINFFPDNISVEETEIDAPTEVQQETSYVVDENQTAVENETLVENVTLEDTPAENTTGFFKGVLIQGHAVYEENKSVVNIISYALGIFILIVPLFFFFKKRIIKKVSAPMNYEYDENDFEKAEQDLKKARDKIDELRGKKLEEAKKKLLEDERELMRLRNLGR
jgi:hypothetical protein